MKLLKGAFRFYINSSIHVSLAVCSLALITTLEYKLDITYSFWFFLFFGTITGYNFVKYAKIAGLHHRSLTNSLKSIQVFSFISFGIVLVFAIKIPIRVLMACMCFGLVTFFYAVPFLKHKNLRTIGGIKIFVVALVWAGITVFVPMIASEMELTADCWISFSQRFLLVLALIIPFEIRDIPYDVNRLKTLPQQIGLTPVKFVGFAFLILIQLLELFKNEMTLAHFIALLFTNLLIGLALVFASTSQSKYFASFWVEGIPILWSLVLLALFEIL